MKIAYGSDLHLEFDALTYVNPLPINNTEKADVLVLAGDVTASNNLTGPVDLFFQHISKEFPVVLYVMGNHEHYHGNFQETKEKLLTFLQPYTNIILLDNDSVVLDGVVFFGGTMWTNLKERDPYIVHHVAAAMNDFHHVKNGERKFLPGDTLVEHDKTIKALTEALAKDDEKVVVITHHSPSAKSCHPRFGGDPTNWAYYTELDQFIGERSQIKAWFHGHTHDEYDYMINETRVLCNPRGYVGYQASARTWQLKHVEV